MFVVWENSVIKSPYTPGRLHDRKVHRVEPVASTQQVSLQAKGRLLQGSLPSHTSLVEAYQSSDSEQSWRKSPLLAEQIMSSPVVTLPVNASLSDAWATLRKKRFRHIPVLSQQGKLAGILSDRDVFRATIERLTESDESLDLLPHVPIDKIMVRQVLSASPDTEIREITRLFFQERIGAMPMVNDSDELVGILTRSDILRTVVNTAPFELWI